MKDLEKLVAVAATKSDVAPIETEMGQLKEELNAVKDIVQDLAEPGETCSAPPTPKIGLVGGQFAPLSQHMAPPQPPAISPGPAGSPPAPQTATQVPPSAPTPSDPAPQGFTIVSHSRRKPPQRPPTPPPTSQCLYVANTRGPGGMLALHTGQATWREYLHGLLGNRKAVLKGCHAVQDTADSRLCIAAPTLAARRALMATLR